MPANIQCTCQLSEDFGWLCQWATLVGDSQVDRRIAFALEPRQFVAVITYLERVLGKPDESPARPDLGTTHFRLKFRRNAALYELQISGEDGGWKAMVDEPQLKRILAHHKTCLQTYALAIYEGRVPVPPGYPEGYPEPRWG